MNADLATIDAPPELRESVSACVNWSNGNIISNPSDYAATADHLKQIKLRQTQAAGFFDDPIKQAHNLHKMLVRRKQLITGPLDESERIDKQKMLEFQQAEQARAEAERRRLQAEADERARKEREKAEQGAAKQRAVEAAARAKAEAARIAAEQASAAERKKLLAQAESAERKAAAAAVKVEARVEQAQSVSAPVVHVQTVAPSVKGIATREIWKYRVVDVAQIPRDYLMVDDSKLSAFARAMKGGVEIPGVEFYTEKSLSSSRY